MTSFSGENLLFSLDKKTPVAAVTVYLRHEQGLAASCYAYQPVHFPLKKNWRCCVRRRGYKFISISWESPPRTRTASENGKYNLRVFCALIFTVVLRASIRACVGPCVRPCACVRACVRASVPSGPLSQELLTQSTRYFTRHGSNFGIGPGDLIIHCVKTLI